MKRSKRIAIIIAVSVIALGVIIMAGAFFAMNGSLALLETGKITENIYEISESYSDILIDTQTANVNILPSEDGKVRIICKERSEYRYSVEVSEGVLRIQESDDREWYERISFNIRFDNSEISVYMPSGEYGALKVSSNTGNIELSKAFVFDKAHINTDTGDITAELSVKGRLMLESDTGDMKIASLSAEYLSIENSTGDITVEALNVSADTVINNDTGRTALSNGVLAALEGESETGAVILSNVIVSGDIVLESDTGDVELHGCDASELHITTDTGDVYGRLLSNKIYIARSDTGDIRVPSTVSGGICEINTDTGDIEFE